MDDRSDDDLEYRSRYRKLDFSDSPLSISDEEDNGDLLEIKPPQARVRKHGRCHSKHREVYVGSSSRHKGHHSGRHQEERHLKERLEGEPKSRTFSKDSEIDRVKEYEEYRKKKYAHHRREEKPTKEERYRYEDEPRIEERYKELDLREKLERRKIRHQQKEYERNERKEKERKKHAKTVEKELYEDEPEMKKRRHEAESRRREKTPEKEKSRHSKKSRTASQDVSLVRKGMIVDVEMSPPVLKNEYDVYSKNVRDEEEGEVESDEDGSSNSSTDSDSENTETSSSSSSSSGSSQTEVEDREDDKSVKNEDSKDGSKAESPSLITNADGEVDNEIELEKDTLPAYFPAIQGCRSVEEFQCLNRIEEGTYGVVYRAREKKTDKIVALKRLKMEKEKDGFPITSLREINTLLKAQHPNIVTVKEIVVGSNMDKIFIVMDYIEHDLKSLMETMKQKKTSFMSSEVKCLMQQLLKAVNHLHDNWILHRDLKTSNLLFSHTGVLKVGDFGLAREYGSPLKHYTPVVVTLWYRAPELLLGTKEYSTCVDMWSVGCIFAELLNMEPLFPGKTEIDQLNRIFKALGTPNERIWPEFFTFPVTQRVTFTEYAANGIRSKFVPSVLTETGYDLLTSFLTYNTKTRITADTALKHKYFSESPLPIEPAMFPTWPAKSEPGYRKAIASSPKPPSGGQGYKNLGEDDGFYIPVGERNPRGFNLQSTFSLRF